MDCDAVVYHGPGHQSRTLCRRIEPDHEVHGVFLPVTGQVWWRGVVGMTGPLDESPVNEDDVDYQTPPEGSRFTVTSRVVRVTLPTSMSDEEVDRVVTRIEDSLTSWYSALEAVVACVEVLYGVDVKLEVDS